MEYLMETVFISYAHQDQKCFNDIKSIRLNYNNSVDFIDGSLQSPILNSYGDVNLRPPKDPVSQPVRDKIEYLLARSSRLLVLVGNNTHSKEWINWEIETFIRYKGHRDILIMRVVNEDHAGLSNNVHNLEIYNWDMDILKQWLNR